MAMLVSYESLSMSMSFDPSTVAEKVMQFFNVDGHEELYPQAQH